MFDKSGQCFMSAETRVEMRSWIEAIQLKTGNSINNSDFMHSKPTHHNLWHPASVKENTGVISLDDDSIDNSLNLTYSYSSDEEDQVCVGGTAGKLEPLYTNCSLSKNLKSSPSPKKAFSEKEKYNIPLSSQNSSMMSLPRSPKSPRSVDKSLRRHVLDKNTLHSLDRRFMKEEVKSNENMSRKSLSNNYINMECVQVESASVDKYSQLNESHPTHTLTPLGDKLETINLTLTDVELQASQLLQVKLFLFSVSFMITR